MKRRMYPWIDALNHSLSGCPPFFPLSLATFLLGCLTSLFFFFLGSSLLFSHNFSFIIKIPFSLIFHLPTTMALRLNPLPTQSFALPQMASLRSPRFRMASTLRSGSKSVLQLSDLLLLTQIMHSPFFSLPSFSFFPFLLCFSCLCNASNQT